MTSKAADRAWLRPASDQPRVFTPRNGAETATLAQELRAVLEREFPLGASAADAKRFSEEDFEKVQPATTPGTASGGRLFEVGMPVEVFGAGGAWHPGRVTRVIEQVDKAFEYAGAATPSAGDLRRFYNVGDKKMCPESAMSLPLAFLRRKFGPRPMLWQQWALLRLEERLRFQESHPRDFLLLHAVAFGKALWAAWLADPRNAEFRRRVDESGFGHYLEARMLHPFELVDLQTREGGAWHVGGAASVSVYTYLSVLGSGGWLCLTVFFIQIAVPVCLFLDSRRIAESRIFVWEEGFCRGGGDPLGKLMLVAVMLLYVAKVIPELMWGSLRVIGATEDPMALNTRLRRATSARGEDNMQQRLGLALDTFMNTTYKALLYHINIVILFNTDDPTNLLLNALAIAFVHTLDEEVANAGWWDPGRRFLQAGCVELGLRTHLRLDLLRDPGKLCAAYAINEEAYLELLLRRRGTGDVNISLKDAEVSREDVGAPRWAVDEEDRLWLLLTQEAKATANFAAQRFYGGAPRRFEEFYLRQGLRYLRRVLTRNHGDDGWDPEVVFARFREYYCWSKFDAVLFLPEMGFTRGGVGTNGKGEAGYREERKEKGVFVQILSALAGHPVAQLANFKELVVGHLSAEKTALGLAEVTVVASGMSFWRRVRRSAKRGERAGLLFSILYGVLEWVGCLLCLSYPFVLVAYVVFLPFCY